MSWRTYADWAKRRPLALRLADQLGRGRGRLRFFDRAGSPPPSAPLLPDLASWDQHALAAIWIGHATVLLRIGGLNVLTDPVLSDRIGVGLGLFTGGPRRLVAPALSWRQLPPLDLILITHAHFDHLDRPTLARLGKSTPVITAAKTADLVRDLGYRRVTELRWDASTAVGSLSITARPARHWGARAFFDQHRGYNAYELQSSAHRVLAGGDSAYHDLYRALEPVDLAILGIGAYDPYIAAHATPEQAWSMADHLRARYLLPVHHSTFRLSHEPVAEPLARLLAVAGDRRRRIALTRIGEQWTLNGSAVQGCPSQGRR